MAARSLNDQLVGAVALALVAGGSAAAAPTPVVDTKSTSTATNVSREEIENLPTIGRNVADLLRACPSTTIPTLSSQPQTLIDGVPTSPTRSIDCVQPHDLEMIEVYKAHNAERALYGYPPVVWNPVLARNAQAHANRLGQINRLEHASREGRGTERESISQGLPGWNANQMMANWFEEKQYFRPGIFPDVSTTDNWSDIGHYTAIIWLETTDLGCGMTRTTVHVWLVCRYNPGGNKDGKPVGLPQMPSPRHVVAGTPAMPQMRAVVGQQSINPGGDCDLPRLRTTEEALRRCSPIGDEPRNSTTTTAPPPPPTARDDAPDGDEARHPLNGYFADAFIRHSAAVDCGDQAAADAEMDKMRYSLDELKKRLKAARQAGPYSAVKPADVQKQIDDMEAKMRSAEQRRRPGACPPMPQPRGVVSQ